MSGSRMNLAASSTWEALGPFPSGMREHPYLGSPLHAFNPTTSCQESELQDADVHFARQQYDESYTLPSELATGGRAGWKRYEAGEDGWVAVQYPDIRWEQLRAEHGWSALQYTSILRTRISVPASSHRSTTAVRIDTQQVIEYAFIPASGPVDLPLIWYQGDIYDYASSLSGTAEISKRGPSNLARGVKLQPGKYVLLVRAIYEIRMFGDPRPDPPTIRFKMGVYLEEGMDVKLVPGLVVLPDVLDGRLMGDWVSIPLRAGPHIGSVELVGIRLKAGAERLTIEGGVDTWRVLGGQTRPLAVRIRQDRPIHSNLRSLRLTISVKVDGKDQELASDLELRHRSLSDMLPFMIAFPSPTTPPAGHLPSLVSFAMVVPPKDAAATSSSSSNALKGQSERDRLGHLPPVLLALHGAGVDVRNTFWAGAIPDRPGGWAVLPQGKTEWGEDWHGGSMSDAWAARDAMGEVVQGKLSIELSEETILAGHSNGGQGAWHMAARYPDRVSGVLAASGWQTIQDYVPYTGWVSRHYTDPSLLSLLSTSLAPYANDLHLTNLTHIHVLAIHGSEDDNVPPRHGRSLSSTLIAYSGGDEQYVKYVEVPKKGHWWMEVLKQEEVLEWMAKLPEKESSKAQLERGFELTAVNPDECGGRAGLRVLEVDVPGRMARLSAQVTDMRVSEDGSSRIRQRNVKRARLHDGRVYTWDKQAKRFDLDFQQRSRAQSVRRYGPMIRILASSTTITIVVGSPERHKDLALRMAHDIYLNHRVDVVIKKDSEILRGSGSYSPRGSLVLLGRPDQNQAVSTLTHMQQAHPPVSFISEKAIRVGVEIYDEPGTGLIALWPHLSDPESLALILAGTDEAGMERAARLFPIRTGVPVPEWVVIDADMGTRGAGGIRGAGYWGGSWEWSDQMSWTAT